LGGLHKLKKLALISPYVFENFLIIALELEWLKLFKSMPTFDVIIDNEKKLHLISKEVIQ